MILSGLKSLFPFSTMAHYAKQKKVMPIKFVKINLMISAIGGHEVSLALHAVHWSCSET